MTARWRFLVAVCWFCGIGIIVMSAVELARSVTR